MTLELSCHVLVSIHIVCSLKFIGLFFLLRYSFHTEKAQILSTGAQSVCIPVYPLCVCVEIQTRTSIVDSRWPSSETATLRHVSLSDCLVLNLI